MREQDVSISYDLACELLRRVPHAAGCAEELFNKHNRHLPATHPAWENRPACECAVDKLRNAMRLSQAKVSDLSV